MVAVASLLVAVASAVYARGSRDAAVRANEINVRESRRALRLQVFQSMHQFSDYCCKYWTLYCMGQVKRSRNLSDRIDAFKWEMEQNGHLDMPGVEAKATELIKKAWQMQRLIDRIAGSQCEPLDRAYKTAQENVEALVDWFSKENRELKTLFQPYLSAA